ncbi:hypothetical protein EVG20_g6263 [Dentipellis fragilis]|uniref:Uncharacterized protein n=1 Tax=Dentipellis fragilis TaxID=205917 RepID=A0A4Y9YMD0_9AGAM|nr:hypothetical protein EVG20_g6263 [Dentipellis fragilis]
MLRVPTTPSYPSQFSAQAETTRMFARNLMNLWRYAAAHGAEAYLYGAVNFLFTAFCLCCKHSHKDMFISLHPQAVFEYFSSPTTVRRRYPDFAVLGTFYQKSITRSDPRYKKPFLGFWVEVKPFPVQDDWFSKESQTRTVGSVAQYLSQVSEQADCAFHHHGGATYRAILIIGYCFTLLEYTNPAYQPEAPPAEYTRSASAPRSVDVQVTPHRPRKRSAQSPLSPEASESHRRRRKKKKPSAPSAQSLLAPPPLLSQAPPPPPPPQAPPAPDAIPPKPSAEAASLIPKIIYFHEPVMTPDYQGLDPRFLRALELAMEKIDVSYDDPTFVCPPGEHPPTEGIEDYVRGAIEEAFHLAPDTSSESESPSPERLLSPPYQGPPKDSSLQAHTQSDEPRQLPFTRQRARSAASSDFSPAVETLMDMGFNKIDALRLASDNQAAAAQLAGEDVFSDSHDPPVASSSRATGSYRNSFHEALASSSGSSGSPYVFDDRLLGSEGTGALSDVDPVPSSHYSSDVDAWSSEQEFDDLDELTSSDVEASADEEESARYVSRKGKERAF